MTGKDIVFTGKIEGNDPHQRQKPTDFLDSCCQCGESYEDCLCTTGCYHKPNEEIKN